jgi:pyruvate kinase
MVARGDLGVETSPEEVPLAQKMIIEKCGIAGKPVIVATQMLDSMINNPRPTRAEATDVANAVFDGADAIMLSGETAAGKYPVEAVAMMDRIARKVERVAYRRGQSRKRRRLGQFSIPDAISHGAAMLADDIDARYIVAFTYAGTSAKLVSRCRTPVPILAMTHSEAAIRGLSLFWGIEGILVPEADDTDALMEIARKTLLERNLVQALDIVVISTGVPLSVSGTTNMVRVLQFPSEKLERRSALLEKNGRQYTWEINESACVYCGNCARICSCGIYTVGQKEIHLNEECLKDCYFDLQCVFSCPVGALRIQPAD